MTWTSSDALANHYVDAAATFPRDAPPTKAKLVELVVHLFKDAIVRIKSMLEVTGGAIIEQYILALPADWVEFAVDVVRKAATQAGETSKQRNIGGVLAFPVESILA